MYQVRKAYLQKRKAIIRLQANMKRFLAQKKYQRTRDVAITFQSLTRMWKARKSVKKNFTTTYAKPIPHFFTF